MIEEKENIAITICPNCKLNTAILLDHKKTTEEKLIYICQACSNIFTKINSIIPIKTNKEN